MNRYFNFRNIIIGGLAVLIMTLLVVSGCGERPVVEQRWYKGNLHTHTLWSDGGNFPDVVTKWYRDHGYDFLALTEHNVLAEEERWLDITKMRGGRPILEAYWTEIDPALIDDTTMNGIYKIRLRTYAEIAGQFNDPEKFLLIPGFEITKKVKRRAGYINVINSTDVIYPVDSDNMVDHLNTHFQAATALAEQSDEPLLAILSHPNFGWGVSAEQLREVPTMRFMEVYCGHPGKSTWGDSSHASVESIWDIVLAFRLREAGGQMLYGIGADDAHEYRVDLTGFPITGLAWVMVRAQELTAPSIISAMQAGEFYFSTGVEIEDIAVTDEGLALQLAPEEGLRYRTEFVGTLRGFDERSEPRTNPKGAELPTTRYYSDEIGTVLATVAGNSPAYSFTGEELYVRARVRSSRPYEHSIIEEEMEMAWTQPVAVSAKR